MTELFVRRRLFAVALMVACGASGANPRPANPKPASLILWDAKVMTMDAQRTVAKAIAVRGDKIVKIGSNEEMTPYYGPHTRAIKLSNRLVLPGFIDAHTHAVGGSMNFALCDVSDEGFTAFTQVVTAAKTCITNSSTASPGKWFQVVGVNNAGLTITKSDVDQIASDRPVVVWGVDGHSAWINTYALQLLNITASTPVPPGGVIGKDGNGNPTGMLLDAAYNLVVIPWDANEVADLTERGLALMAANGITSIQDASVTQLELDAYKRLADTGRLKQRVRLDLLSTPNPDSVSAELTRIKALRAQLPAAQYPLIKADGTKFFLDGVLESSSQTAALLQPYLDGSGNSTGRDGAHYYDPLKLSAMTTALDGAGFSIQAHAIGDRATRDMLNAVQVARQTNGPSFNVHQIAHLELVNPADFARFQALNVFANMQLYWATPDIWAMDYVLPYLGPARHRYIYPAASLKNAGATVVSGSDWPVSSFNPLDVIQQGITRDDSIANGFFGMHVLYPQERLDLDTMLASYTTHAAKALRLEHQVGSLEVGKQADIVVLDRDISRYAVDKIRMAQTLYTLVNGEVIYDATASDKATWDSWGGGLKKAPGKNTTSFSTSHRKSHSRAVHKH